MIMKKFIITIFIIFAYGIPQVFAVPHLIPNMYRYIFLLPKTNLYINNYTAYANAANQIKWYLPKDRTILKVKYKGKTYRIRLADIIQEALNEWKSVFTQPAITFVRTNNINEATIHMSVNTTEEASRPYAVTSARGLFNTSKDFGEIVFNYQPIVSLLNDGVAEKIRELINKPSLSEEDILNYLLRFFAKHESGHLFGAEHTLITPVDDSRESLTNPRDRTETSTFTIVYQRVALRTDPPSIMIRNPVNYFTYLRRSTRNPINLEDITVTNEDRAEVREENVCTNPPPHPTQKGYSFKLNCNTSEISAVISSYGANNTARTTALRTS